MTPTASDRNFASQDLQLTVRSVITRSLLAMQTTCQNIPALLPSTTLL